MPDKLIDAIKLLREYCGNIPLSNAIINIVEHDRAVEEVINKLRKENENCKAQYQHWDERYSEALIKMREMKEEIEKLKTEVNLYKSSMNHYKGITLKNKSKLELERDYIKIKYDIFKNTVQAMLPDETVKKIYSEFTKRMNEWTSEEVYKQIEPLFKKEEKMINRELVNEVAMDNYDGNYNLFFDEIEQNSTISFTVFRSVNDSLYDGDILILDNETNEFISWYKLTHIGRDLHTNITTEEQLRRFIQKFYDCNKEES